MSAQYKSDAFFLEKLTSIVEERYENEEFGVSDLAVEIGLSQSQLHRKVKLLCNKTTSKFIRDIRLKKARDLLMDESQTVKQVAYQVGFHSPSYFTRCFMELFGYAPGQAIEHKNEEENQGEKIGTFPFFAVMWRCINKRMRTLLLILSITVLVLLYVLVFRLNP